MTKVAALIVAGGTGQRLGSETPKQYIDIAGVSVLRHTLNQFEGLVDVIKVVISPQHEMLYGRASEGLDVLPCTHGGEERQESVLKGLESLVPENPDIVLIQDAVRPFVDESLINAIIEALNEYYGVIPVIPVKDTLKLTENDLVQATIPRNNLSAAQTPQGFRFGAILEAHRKAAQQNLKFTDDAAVAEHFNIPVKAIPGREENFKITTREDLHRAQKKLESRHAGISNRKRV